MITRVSPNPAAFKKNRTLAVDTFIDIVGQNWFGIARLGTPLQQTAVQRGPLPRWPQLSRVAWARENVSVFEVINRRCPATLFNDPRVGSFVDPTDSVVCVRVVQRLRGRGYHKFVPVLGKEQHENSPSRGLVLPTSW